MSIASDLRDLRAAALRAEAQRTQIREGLTALIAQGAAASEQRDDALATARLIAQRLEHLQGAVHDLTTYVAAVHGDVASLNSKLEHRGLPPAGPSA